MCKFVIAIPLDLPDPNYVKKASQLKVVDKKLPIEAESKDAGDRKSTRLNSSHMPKSRMPSSA